MPTLATINFTYIPDVENSPDDAIPLDTYGEYLVNIAIQLVFMLAVV
jgi:hypothetical protein